MSDSPRTTAADADLSGRTLGDFKLLRRLGRGAMAEVYLAEQKKLRRQVAIKVLKAHLSGDATYVARFQNEAMAAASLVHANIVQIYEVGHADGLHYIAQEYVQGMNLREWLRRNGSPDAKLAVGVMRQVAAALHKAALTGIVHRDIKPENIMLSTSGELKVADFGLARITRDDDALALTQVGITMGTPLYMSPEQVEGKSLDPRSDIYSFGVTCYHMLAGAPPFQGDTALAVAVQHLKSEPRKLEDLRPDLPAQLCRIVHRMMAKKPQDRYASAREMVRELRTLPIAADADDASWSAELDQQSALEQSVAAGLQSATQHLDALMKTQAVVLKRREPKPRLLLIAVVAAFVLGGAAAGVKAWREPRILKPLTEARVPRRDTADAQLAAALWPGPDSEERLKSVEFYFPDAQYQVSRARQELARLYWQESRLDEALSEFNHFAGMLNEDYQNFGLAGQSLVYTKQGAFDKAAEAIGRLQLKKGLARLDPQMAEDIQYALTANRKALAERNLLPAAAAHKIRKEPSAEAQWNLARVQLDDLTREESLQSVIAYFPRDTDYVELAKQELARMYLQQNRLAQATPIFAEFAAADRNDPTDRAFGLAGRAIVEARNSDSAAALRTLTELAPLADRLDPTMAKSLSEILTAQSLDRLPKPAADFWRQWQARTLSAGNRE
jgi:tRNA A-37 threonylcarbamoyl transferase component Bud32/uncharacterized protein YqgQ